MKYQVGDIVLILHSNEEGRVVDIMNDKMMMVDVKGVIFPVFMDQVDFPIIKDLQKRNYSRLRKKKFLLMISEKKKKTRMKKWQMACGLPIYP